jgi:hypothetical protein
MIMAQAALATGHATRGNGTVRFLLMLADLGSLTVLAAGLASARAARRRRLDRQWYAHAFARQIIILSPAQPVPGGGHVLWSKLARILPAGQRVSWEYDWTGGHDGGPEISVWVPGGVPEGVVEQAIEEAWPGTHALTFDAEYLLLGTPLVAGGTVKAARRSRKPDASAGVMPGTLRALSRAAACLEPGEHAIVQVLARPTVVAWSRSRRGHRRRQPGSRARGLLLKLAAAAGSHRRPGIAPPVTATWWDTRARFIVAAATAPAAPGSWGELGLIWRHRAEQMRLAWLRRNLAAAVSAARSRPHWSPAGAINSRSFRRGRLLSVPEIAALATLPPDADWPGSGPGSGCDDGGGTPR